MKKPIRPKELINKRSWSQKKIGKKDAWPENIHLDWMVYANKAKHRFKRDNEISKSLDDVWFTRNMSAAGSRYKLEPARM
jgi:hypothetical protein